ncbi:MAG: hypothetical protein JW894_14710 [Bacteroidales bacterium]|nr:hypothetical protein [Bacteroidales bacterium]
MSVKPYITLLFVVSVLTILLLISMIFPDNGIRISENFKLRFTTPREIFRVEETKYADISNILESNELLTDSVLAELVEEKTEIKFDTVRANADSLRKSISFIKFPNGNKESLYKTFRAFDMASASANPVRIMHYGDSQIEGDRITSFLRNRLQKKFGGTGVGLVPVQQVYDFKYSITQENSDNWYRYTLYGNRDTTITHDRFGALASFCRFTPYYNDTTKELHPEKEAWVSFSPSNYSFTNTKSFQQCRVFYSHNEQPFMAEIFVDGSLYDADFFPESNGLKTIRWRFDQPVSNAELVFKGNESPEIYGIALDGISGVAVDNIAMRGNAGLVFCKMDKDLLHAHYKELNVKLFILQFGGNVVPYMKGNFDYYERLFFSQLRRIHDLVPDAAIIVIGVADMSTKEKGRYISYPNIENIRNALQSATFRAGAAYWDMYEAMGGKNSMPSWVFANPPIASKDFVHFNTKGAKIIAHMFYNSLMYEYNLYKRNNTSSQ